MTINQIFPQFKNKYKKALVTGGAGFIGSHICESLVTRGFQVISIDDYSAGKKINLYHLKKYQKFQEVNCDITDYKKLARYFKDVDIIFHNAASKKSICLKDPRRDLLVNGTGTFNLLELSIKNKVKKFVHASTGSVYGERVAKQDEDHPLNPVSYYGVSKLAGEKYVGVFHKLYNLDTTVLRYFHVYGSRQESNEYGGVVAIFTRKVLLGENPIIFGTGKQERSFTHVDDVVLANLIAATNSRTTGQIYNCASGISITINELCREVIKYFHREDLKPIYKDWMVGDIKKFQIDNTRLKKLGVNFQTDFSKILSETIKELTTDITYASKKPPQVKK